MKKVKYIFIVLFTILIVGCNSNKQVKNIPDTTQIIVEIFKPNSELIEGLNHSLLDTIFILKSKKYYNQTWPNSVKNYKLIYIEDGLKSRYFNKPGSGKIDLRNRFDFVKFDIKIDTAFVEITYFNSPTGYDCKLVKKQGNWYLKDIISVSFNPIKSVGYKN